MVVTGLHSKHTPRLCPPQVSTSSLGQRCFVTSSLPEALPQGWVPWEKHCWVMFITPRASRLTVLQALARTKAPQVAKSYPRK